MRGAISANHGKARTMNITIILGAPSGLAVGNDISINIRQSGVARTLTTTTTTIPTHTSYNGNYNDTLNGVLTVMTVNSEYNAETVGATDGITAPGGASVVNAKFWAVSQGTGSNGQSSIYGITGLPTPIPVDGIVGGLALNTFELSDPSWNASSASFKDGACSAFVMQFSSEGATSTTITCEGGFDIYNDTLNFVGTLTLSPCYLAGSNNNASDAKTVCNY